MHRTLQKSWFVILIFALALALAACVDEHEQTNGENNGEVNQNQGDHDGDGDGAVECPDGEVLNPFDGTCHPEEEPISPGDGDNGDDEDDGDDDGDGDFEEPTACGPGALHGQVCTTDGSRLPAADVQVVGMDCYGQYFERTAQTDGDGVFYIDNIPAGHHDLLVTSGSFSAERSVDIEEGKVNDTMMQEVDKVCVSGDVNILVVNGSFDDIGSLLDGLNLDYDLNTDTTQLVYLLSNLPDLLEYDIIFFPCGSRFNSLQSSSGDMNEMINNLRLFVQQGNSIYASDWSHDFVVTTFPNAMQLHDPPRPSDSQTFMADVVSTPMQILLGSNTVEITYNLPGVGQLVDAFPPSVVHFRGNVQTSSGTLYGVPIMTSYTDPIGGGTAIYTSFHNSAQASGDMLDILNFMIFQL